MTSGIISIIIGLIWFTIGFFGPNTHSAVQETVQLLVLVNGSIFFIGGLILCQLWSNKQQMNSRIMELSAQLLSGGKKSASSTNENVPKENKSLSPEEIEKIKKDIIIGGGSIYEPR